VAGLNAKLPYMQKAVKRSKVNRAKYWPRMFFQIWPRISKRAKLRPLFNGNASLRKERSIDVRVDGLRA
jgi:hypothetical protein